MSRHGHDPEVLTPEPEPAPATRPTPGQGHPTGPDDVLTPRSVGQILALQRSAGNAAVTRLVAPSESGLARQEAGVGAASASVARLARSPRLRTALDSQVRVSGGPERYSVSLDLDSPEGGECIVIAEYEPVASTTLRQLPVFIEDVVTDDRVVVTIRYDPAAAVVTPAFLLGRAAGRSIVVRLVKAGADELSVAAAPRARNAGAGVTIEGSENVTQHSSGSEVDKVMGSVASAEGGFASVEGSDRGVFTWGQGQWTVTGGELQKVMAFIKARREDLFDRYWTSAGLDIGSGPTFIYQGRPYATNAAQMMALFRPSRDRVRAFAEIFAQAGMDPQIQRLQREYMRDETTALLDRPVGGQVPDDVLNTRGKAFYYSMDKNGPAFASAAFRDAVHQAGLQAGQQVTEAQRTQVSVALEAYFRNSGVVAWSQGQHHILGFWGERGRQQALDLADQRIQAPVPADAWSTADWRQYRQRMQQRQSRYQKTAGDITSALARRDVEPDVPEDTAQE